MPGPKWVGECPFIDMWLTKMMITLLFVVFITTDPVSGFLCQQSCTDSHDDIQCALPTSCRPRSHEGLCQGQQCIELNIENMGSQVLQKTIIDREESNLKISSVNVVAGPAGRAQCALGTAIWFNSTSLFAQPGCDVKLQVCLHLHYGDTRDFNSAEGDCKFVQLKNEGPLNIVSVDHRSKVISSMTFVSESLYNNDKCVSGKTFGFYKWYAYTRKGCSGSFKICFAGISDDNYTKRYKGRPQHDYKQPFTCTNIRLLSRINRPVEMRITDQHHQEVTIKSLVLAEEDSDNDCIQNVTYSFSGDTVRAWSGCRGTFHICYLSLGTHRVSY
ncbi:hypothetical protein BgiMline_016336 [Biomphalaria glabrata]|nr:hypothetical protein BgiMline_009133 [Biomphalaria glabrata]